VIEYGIWVLWTGALYVMIAVAILRWITARDAKKAALAEEAAGPPPDLRAYSDARFTLRHHSFHDLESIDAAFEILAQSQDPDDKELCRIAEEELWKVPYPGATVVVVTMIGVALTCVALATFFARMIL